MNEPDTARTDAIPPHPVDAAGKELPGRLVDHLGWGWCRQGRTDSYWRDHSAGNRSSPAPAPHTYGQLLERGPVRPVGLPTDDEDAMLSAVLEAAGRKAVVSVFVALRSLITKDMTAHGGVSAWHKSGRAHLLTGGRGGSHEAAKLIELLPCIDPATVATSRLHHPTVEMVERVVGRWVHDPAEYVEVADTLSFRFGRAADASTNGNTGLATIGDKWLCESRNAERFAVYALQYSEKFGPTGW